jgi:hypothetical protein
MIYVWCAIGAAVGFVLGAVAAGVALIYLPADYFVRRPNEHSLSLPWRIVKNLLGVVLVVLGVVMVFVPGQGLLTIVFGLVLIDFPGKQKLIKKILDRPGLLEKINRLRDRYGKPPLLHHTA